MERFGIINIRIKNIKTTSSYIHVQEQKVLNIVSETLMTLGKEPKYLGAEIGFISILHTWGQNLMYHPHINKQEEVM